MNIVKKFLNDNVNITKLLHIVSQLTIRNLDPRSSDPSQLRLVIRTHDHTKNPKENFKLKRNSRWPTTRTLDLPSSPGAMGGPYRWLVLSSRASSTGPPVNIKLTPYMENWGENWQVPLCDFTSCSTKTSACARFAGKLIIGNSKR